MSSKIDPGIGIKLIEYVDRACDCCDGHDLEAATIPE